MACVKERETDRERET